MKQQNGKRAQAKPDESIVHILSTQSPGDECLPPPSRSRREQCSFCDHDESGQLPKRLKGECPARYQQGDPGHDGEPLPGPQGWSLLLRLAQSLDDKTWREEQGQTVSEPDAGDGGEDVFLHDAGDLSAYDAHPARVMGRALVEDAPARLCRCRSSRRPFAWTPAVPLRTDGCGGMPR